MTTLLEVARGEDGVFYLDEKNKRIDKINVLNGYNLEINFPGSTKEDFTYLKLERIMKYYMDFEEDQTLSDAIQQIHDKGFFFGLKPGLRITVRRTKYEVLNFLNDKYDVYDCEITSYQEAQEFWNDFTSLYNAGKVDEKDMSLGLEMMNKF